MLVLVDATGEGLDYLGVVIFLSRGGLLVRGSTLCRGEVEESLFFVDDGLCLGTEAMSSS
jgi:hypothetical protein